ncbi:TPA: DotU family type IV/VI secretion system protein [Salmonella enterica]|nr:DotU family type IV/VI secretion system protein [Salmonella enterica]
MTELIDCYLPVFKFVIQITSDPISFTDYKSTRGSCISSLELADNCAEYTDTCDTEKSSARFAVIAWMDEIILRSSLSWRQNWQCELLQRKYLDITTAGERFFTDLDELPPEHIQARKVFLFCLQNGFCGRYITSDSRSELLAVIENLRRLVLPEEWLQWPNETAVTPFCTRQFIITSRSRHPFLLILLIITFMYAFLFSLLYQFI